MESTLIKNTYRVLGVMSGSSLDGLDLALIEFQHCNKNGWQYKVLDSKCVAFTKKLHERLKSIAKTKIQEFIETDIALGKFIGSSISNIYADTLSGLDFICSHGHTALHLPEKGYTLQIGNGAKIAAITGRPVVCDLRSMDIAYGGQGAPIVPLGEHHLFAKYNTFLNIGGICNISHHSESAITAFDVGPGNTLLNIIANELGKKYDNNGEMSKSGKVLPSLLEQMNNWNYYNKNGPKSLSTEDLKEFFLPLFSVTLDKQDILRTIVEHIALQIAKHDKEGENEGMITGGGAHNDFLVQRINALSKVNWQVPDQVLIDFKEAIIIAFLGALRWRQEVNVSSSVTGAIKDSIGGAIYFAKS